MTSTLRTSGFVSAEASTTPSTLSLTVSTPPPPSNELNNTNWLAVSVTVLAALLPTKCSTPVTEAREKSTTVAAPNRPSVSSPLPPSMT